MPQLTILSPSQQVAQHLRARIMRGAWNSLMPGAPQLAEEFGIDRKTVEAALKLLEQDGLLIAQGPGKKRKIHLPKNPTPTKLRIALLASEDSDRSLNYMVEIHHKLSEDGHNAFYSSRYLNDLDMDVRRVARLVKQTEADAWIVVSANREVLEWFSEQPFPSFAMFGRRIGLKIPAVGPDKLPPLLQATRALIRFGHRRIVLMTRPRRRLPVPGSSEKAFLAELEHHGLPVGDYNLPPWEETIEDYHARLETLFRSTPPTALIVDEVVLFLATQQFLAKKRIRVPDDVSLICTDTDPCFDWCQPEISRISWDIAPVVRRVVRWASQISHNKTDFRQTLTPARFISGGTIGPVRKEPDHIR
jgi:DNA-binding LacI/PurR family transcriptional regulator